MKYTCYSDGCCVWEECPCEAECCSGGKEVPKVMEVIDDHHIRIINNDKIIEIDDTDLTYNLVMAHQCPFCNCWVEA